MTFFNTGPSEEGQDLGPPPGPFRFRRRPNFRIPGGLLRWATALLVLLVVFIVASILKNIYADWLWFDSVDYLSVYRLRIVTRVWLFFAGAGVFLAFFGVNVLIALRLAPEGTSEPVAMLGDVDPHAVRRVVLVVTIAAALFLSVIFGVQAAGQWNRILLFMNSESFGIKDAAFGRDIGFYVFQLPALNFIQGWSLAAVIITTIAVGGLYAFRMLLSGFDAETSRAARIQVSLLLVAAIGLFVWRYWLGRYGLVFSDRGAAFGASYTDIHAQVPVTYALMGLGALTAVCILIAAVRRGLLILPIGAAVVWAVAGVAGGLIFPATVQRFSVEPNELAKEREYIQRNIEATRAAYGLDQIEEVPFPAREFVTAEEIAANPETISNVRLWDHRPLLQTLNQIQTIRPLYDFLNVDVDRYMIDGQLRQVMLAARELNPGKLPVNAQTWVNSRLQFTHGYGLTVVPVNEVVQEGLPELYVKDIPVAGKVDVEVPQIYFGEMPDHYVIVGSAEDEFDYPTGDDEVVETRFDGDGGIKLNSLLRRFVYSWELSDFNLLISDALDDDSRLLYRRNIQQRVDAIAPFLRLDHDPYLVVADGRLVWVQDAYTTTDQYPYSTRSGGLNYIRNSVKVTIDAYDGSLTFYLVDPTDPIARVYDKIYPDLFTPDEMPDALRAHLRYPEQLFLIQAELYSAYHIQDPRVLYNREDIWDIPTEVFIGQEQTVEPYYVIMRLPGEAEEEFALILPFRPANRNNTIAWMAGRSDGDNYGKLLAFRFPTGSAVFGPSQVESFIDQDEQISAQLSLWNQSGSQVIRGNLLMIPIGEGNLFVEPIYLQATAGQLPELKRVVVANGNNIAMEPTLARALEVVLGQAPPSTPVADGGTPTTPTATPGPGETPEPTSTAAATAVPSDDVATLIQQANDAFERAQTALQNGDFATYGDEIAEVERLLQRLAELTNQ
ncbi:MAG: UPF0182 family protein [Dehalococcoidia bacterium]